MGTFCFRSKWWSLSSLFKQKRVYNDPYVVFTILPIICILADIFMLGSNTVYTEQNQKISHDEKKPCFFFFLWSSDLSWWQEAILSVGLPNRHVTAEFDSQSQRNFSSEVICCLGVVGFCTHSITICPLQKWNARSWESGRLLKIVSKRSIYTSFSRRSTFNVKLLS